MRFHVVIPARWSSTRLPEKMLADIAGTPMIVRVAERAALTQACDITIATDDERIASVVRAAGFDAILTRIDHPTGTDRLAQTVQMLDWPDDEVVVNVQGDEPLMDPDLINAVATSLTEHSQASIATAACQIKDNATLLNPNVVKVVCGLDGNALYFSRASIPFCRQTVDGLHPLHHIGLYAYRASFLRAYPKLTQGLLERAESLEQLRALEHGFKIQVVITDRPVAGGIDTAEDLDRVRKLLSQES